jgi:hypothetical protein
MRLMMIYYGKVEQRIAEEKFNLGVMCRKR